MVNTEVYAFRMGSLLVFFRVYLDRRKLMQDYALRLLPNVNHKLIGLDSLEPRRVGEKEEEWLAKLVQNRLKYGIGQLNLIGSDSLVFLTNSILVSLNYTDSILNPKDDHFVNERLLGDRVLGSRSDLDTAERALNSLMNLNSVYGHKNKTLRGRINLAAANLSDRKEHTKAVKKLSDGSGASGGVNSVSISSNGQMSSSSTSTTTQPSTTKPVVEIFTNTPSYATTSTLKQTITMRPIIQRFTTQSSPDKFNHSSFLYSSPALNRAHTNRLDKPQLFNSLLSSSTATLSTTGSPTGNSSCLFAFLIKNSNSSISFIPEHSRTLFVSHCPAPSKPPNR